ncbi:hypothetical protein PT273_02190 [Orbaceae bacterium ESL0727]|nr:hypothetical protein [Orbaceae bacterium ESL0727]
MGNLNIYYNWDGPASQWDATKGFKPQNINNPSSNFPTMGANNLFFNLIMQGTGANYSTVRYDKSPANSGINLTIENGGSTNIAKITVTGPKYGDSSATANTTVPTTFTIYADTNKTNKIYSFTISKWFITRRGETGVYNANYCRNTYGSNYRIPNVAEYTNANGNGWTGGLPGQPNNYQRRIGGGLFAEWGNSMASRYYINSDFMSRSSYWTDNFFGNYVYTISLDYGFITAGVASGATASSFVPVCVTPSRLLADTA